jgi:hypothetical protein
MVSIGISGAQRNFAGAFGFGLMASTTNEASHTPIPTAANTIKNHRTEFIGVSSYTLTTTSLLRCSFTSEAICSTIDNGTR